MKDFMERPITVGDCVRISLFTMSAYAIVGAVVFRECIIDAVKDQVKKIKKNRYIVVAREDES